MFEIIKQITKQIIDSIQNTGIAIGRILKEQTIDLKSTITSHTYKVNVQNPQDKIEVKGTVIVGNQQNVEKKLGQLEKAIQQVYKFLPSLKKIEITNQTKFPEFPKDIKINNLSNDIRVSNINMIVDAIDTLQVAISKLKLSPEIKIQPPNIAAPIVNIPKQDPPIIKVTQEKMDLSVFSEILTYWQSLSGSAKKSLSVRLTDGDKFYKAIDRLVEEVANVQSSFQYTTGEGGRALLNRNNEVRVTVNDTWDANDVEKVSSVLTYFGESSIDGNWRVRKVTKSGNFTALRHATIRNNPSYDSYVDAWTDRTNLTYGYASDAL